MSDRRLTDNAVNLASPCVRNCCLDDQDVCLGCFRTLDEILAWGNASDEQKQQILLLTSQRKEARNKPSR